MFICEDSSLTRRFDIVVKNTFLEYAAETGANATRLQVRAASSPPAPSSPQCGPVVDLHTVGQASDGAQCVQTEGPRQARELRRPPGVFFPPPVDTVDTWSWDWQGQDVVPSAAGAESFVGAAAVPCFYVWPSHGADTPSSEGESEKADEEQAQEMELSCATTDVGTDSDSGSAASTPGKSVDSRTTIMLRNLPNNYSREMLLDLLDRLGYMGKFDFLYLPIDFGSKAALGYAFINLVSESFVPEFWRTFDGFSRWDIPTKKHCMVSWSTVVHGLAANVQRYRNSPVMHCSVRDDFKPVVFEQGGAGRFSSANEKSEASTSQVARGDDLSLHLK
eukprot:CAMPEP_0117467908 /NCGR_PEP_ID=MMETSP0784-20121206/5902_1 /TAXON_ID=39447 /ORGANISM="" /LENGTH=333 /DNA_ID=CAMNT_0005261899 /DNA_START=30 /DNA_END=1030 /DNA_ORIENTATION=-